MKKVSPLNQTLLDELYPRAPSKSQLTRARIVDSAIELFGSFGLEETTYDKIAKASKVSRALVVHYFPDRKGLFLEAMRHIRARLQKVAVDALAKESSPSRALAAYVDSTFSWVDSFPEHARVWALFYYYCGIDQEAFRTNSGLVQMGFERIGQLLRAGVADRSFRCSDIKGTAKMIQVVITGALIATLTEDMPLGKSTFRKKTKETCLRLAGAT